MSKKIIVFGSCILGVMAWLWIGFAEAAPLIQKEDGRLIIENTSFRYEFSTKDYFSLDEIVNKYINAPLIKEKERMALFSLVAIGEKERTRLSSRNFKVDNLDIIRRDSQAEVKLLLSTINSPFPLSAELSILVDDSNRSIWSLRFTNTGGKEIKKMMVAFPLLSGIRLGEIKDNYYLLPYHDAGISNYPLDVRYGYGGGASMQIVDIYNPKLGGGIYIRSHSQPEQDKWLSVRKADNTFTGTPYKEKSWVASSGEMDWLYAGAFLLKDSLGMGINYVEKSLFPGETFKLPEVAIGLHKGDFRQAMNEYKEWIDTWFKREHKIPESFKYSFSYKMHNLFDCPTGYSPRPIIVRSSKWPGGIDVMEIGEWWGNLKEQYAVKDYFSAKEKAWGREWGGEKALKDCVSSLQKEGMNVLFYLEGMLTPKQYQEIWKIENKPEEVALMNSPGASIDYGPDFYFGCPGTAIWRDMLASACADAVKKYDIDAIRLDSLGAQPSRLCYNPAHHHSTPGIWVSGTAAMIKEIRAKSPKPNIPIITEMFMGDYLFQYLDGALGGSLVLSGLRRALASPPVSVFRFYFPEVKLFSIVSEVPAGDERDNYRVALFNGIGFSYYGMWKTEFNSYLKNISRVLKENGDAFTTLHPVPLIKTEKEKTYANMFPGEEKVIYTLINEGESIAQGELLRVKHQKDSHYLDLLNHEEIKYEVNNDEATLSLTLKGKDVICIGQMPSLLKVTKEDSKVKVTIREGLKKPLLKVLLARKWGRFEGKIVQIEGLATQFEPEEIFGEKGGELILQLFDGRFLVDEKVIGTKPGQMEDIVKYDFLETFDSEKINEENWEVIGGKEGEVRVKDGRFHLLSQNRNQATTLKSKKKFEHNKKFTLGFDLQALGEGDGWWFRLGYGDCWQFLFITDGAALQIFTKYKGQSQFWGGAGMLMGRRWHHFEITNEPEEITLKVTDMEEHQVVYEETFNQDKVDISNPLEFCATLGEIDPALARSEHSLDNIGWIVEK